MLRNLFPSLFLTVLVLTSPIASAAFPFEEGDRVLVLGDSITQDGRYVALVEAYTWATFPEADVEFVGAGLSSETVSGITEPVHPYPRPNINDRVDRAIELFEPDWALVCYGMNDGIYHPISESIRDSFRRGLGELIGTLQRAGVKVILVTPPPFDPRSPQVQQRLAESAADDPSGYRRPYEKYDETLEQLAQVTLEFADHPAVERVIRLHEPVAEYLEAAHRAEPQYVYGDGVHPPLDGHYEMAVAVLTGLDQPEQQVRQTLTQITGIRPVPSSGPTQAEDADAEARWREIDRRFRDYAAAVRGAIGHARQPAAEPGTLQTARDEADERERQIRKTLVTAGT